MSKPLRSAQQIGVLYLEEIDWYFRVYLMLSDPTEPIDRNILFTNLAEKVHKVAAEYLSEEYEYIQTGFIVAHYGRRGVTYSIWHWADWGGTWEFFSHAWYCYERCVGNMTPLDRTEPIFCQHEIAVVIQEGLAFRDIVSHLTSHVEIVSKYRGSDKATCLIK